MLSRHFGRYDNSTLTLLAVNPNIIGNFIVNIGSAHCDLMVMMI
jgi:hypothetical protein